MQSARICHWICFALLREKGWWERGGEGGREVCDSEIGWTVVRRVRAWDLASTLPSEAQPDPDFTAGVLIARTKSGYYIIEDVVHGRWRAGELEHMLVEQAQKDIEMYGYSCLNYLPIEPFEQ